MDQSNLHPGHAMQADAIEALVRPMLLGPLPTLAYEQLALYVALVERWNRRMNLTAIRDPKTFVQLHIGESLRCAQLLPGEVTTAMDFGSGAGLPGIPIQIARPEWILTLAESQNKKAAFLREAIRELGLVQPNVHAGRVEDMSAGLQFDLVTLRAVDKMTFALQAAIVRTKTDGWIAVLTSQREKDALQSSLPAVEWIEPEAIPGSNQRIIMMGRKLVEVGKPF